MEQPVNLRLRNGVAEIMLNRPSALNALNEEMVEPLGKAFAEAADDPKVKCVLLCGAGDHFMAGGDLKNFSKQLEKSASERQGHFGAMIERLHPTIALMASMPKPVIAKVQGAAAGFGLSLVLASDLAIASEEAYFTMAYCLIGTSPDGGSSFHLPRTVGLKTGMEMALFGGRFDAQEALARGLINKVVPLTELERESWHWAERLAQGPARALGRTKLLLRQSLSNELSHQLNLEKQAFAASASEDDFAEGVQAFLEKRKADFGKN